MHVLKLGALVLGGLWAVELAVCVAVLTPVMVRARSDRALTREASSAAAFTPPAPGRNEGVETGVSAPLTAS